MNKRILFFLILVVIASSCQRYVPKPKGYPRFDFPAKKYEIFDSVCPFKFEYPVYGQMIADEGGYCWFNLDFPQYLATLYLSYQPVNNNLAELLDDSHEFIYKHTIKADAINELYIHNTENDAVGLLFDIGGNAASPLQFFMTDSTSHFIRGSLYFYSTPNRDSLDPLINFFKEDIEHIMETIDFKY